MLSKPTLLTSGSFGTTETANTILWETPLPHDVVEFLDTQAMWYFAHYRCDMTFTLRLNSTGFNTGIVRLAYLPIGETATGATNILNRCQLSQLECVEMDIARDSEGEFTIPFVNGVGYCSLARGHTHGKLFLYAYTRLNTAVGASPPTYMLSVKLEKVWLDQPAVDARVGGAIPKVDDKVQPQAGQIKRRVKLDSERGVISEALHNVSVGLSHFSKVPLISEIAGGLSWATSVGAKVAAAFGFSKPQITETPMWVTQTTQLGYQNVDGDDHSQSLGLYRENRVAFLPGLSFTDEDELSLSFFTKRWAHLSSFEWRESDLTGIGLYSIGVGPEYFRQYEAPLYTYVPAAFPCIYTEKWRGGWEFKLRVASSLVHTGRLLVVFTPTESALPTIQTYHRCYHIILDISELTEVVFTVPYRGELQYTSTATRAGTLTIMVLGPLKSQSAVTTNSIEVAIQVRGASDLEYAVPKSRPAFQPVVRDPQSEDGIPPVDGYDYDIVSETVEPHAGDERAVVSLGPIPTDRGTTFAEVCIGEKLLSLRQLLKRTTRLTFPDASSSTMAFCPYSVSTVGVSKPTSSWSDSAAPIYSCFTYFRGSMRFKIFNSSEKELVIYGDYSQGVAHQYTTISIANFGNPTTSFVISNPKSGGVIELEVPYYSSVLASSVETAMLATRPSRPEFPTARLIITADEPFQTKSVRVMRSVGEDFNLSHFRYTPQLKSVL